ncbi:hypothetical protein SpiGrapes_0751 [Sphaerochaeta pleomorpha str. Grapes]|uniref:DUF374 domain-containing protein n=1 Tax=Sphaerochaeta pleomorpha (strain ATCC BAA-1885 / DSM 22778 / Grapes) TaxID=158190 RepID=G8QYM3_SPHPG|nr:hypothetical protein [Sphaerochaeta pleomorpha]AEV28586.1 hypothetical protein SpiGrapes_0751 [Sphaerochaeta pleomorpha str. Grapes]
MEKQSFAVRLQGAIFYKSLVLMRKTWKVEIEGQEILDRLYAENKHCLLCFWHGKYIPIFPLLKGYDACVITNQSERGNVITEICRKFGFYNAQIPDEPNRNSYNLMREAMSAKNMCGTASDGPLGPACQVKSGVVRIASALGYSLLPVSVGIRGKIVLKGRWDLREIPLPFAKVCMIFGEPIDLPPNLRGGQVKVWEERATKEISALSIQAETKVEKNKRRKVNATIKGQVS